MSNIPMMKCGHAANAIDTATTKPCCAICAGLVAGYDEVDENYQTPSNRKAQCVYCKREKASSTSLPFFESRSNKDHDTFYCGCRGWE